MRADGPGAEALTIVMAFLAGMACGSLAMASGFVAARPRTCPKCGSTELSRFNKDICLDCHHMKVA